MLMGEPMVTGRLVINGRFRLEPIRLSYLNKKLGLDTAQARRNSPLLNLPARASKLIVGYGGDELPELKRQSREFAAAWNAYGPFGGNHRGTPLPSLRHPQTACAAGRLSGKGTGGCRSRAGLIDGASQMRSRCVAER
jgi:hypothetical protein